MNVALGALWHGKFGLTTESCHLPVTTTHWYVLVYLVLGRLRAVLANPVTRDAHLDPTCHFHA